MKPMKKPTGTPLLVCGCGWPLLIQHTTRHYEATEADQNGVIEALGFIEVEWYANTLRPGIISNPEFPNSEGAAILRVTGKCRQCNAFFDIYNDDVGEGMVTLWFNINSGRFLDPDNPWPIIVKGRVGTRFCCEQEDVERDYTVPLLDVYKEKLQKLNSAISKAYKPNWIEMQRFVIRVDNSDGVIWKTEQEN